MRLRDLAPSDVRTPQPPSSREVSRRCRDGRSALQAAWFPSRFIRPDLMPHLPLPLPGFRHRWGLGGRFLLGWVGGLRFTNGRHWLRQVRNTFRSFVKIEPRGFAYAGYAQSSPHEKRKVILFEFSGRWNFGLCRVGCAQASPHEPRKVILFDDS